jgi:Fusaric acid resistance protein family
LLVTIILGLGATSPNPQVFTINALLATPIAAALVGILEFLILDGVTEFPLLALALAPFMIGAVVAMRWPNPIVAALGRLNLIFILDILAPSNPQPYDPNIFLWSVLFLVAGIGLLLAGQLLFPSPSGDTRSGWLLASARRELDHLLTRRDRRWTPEEAMFRDAVRIAQLAGATRGNPRQRAVLTEALSHFDEAAAIRLRYAGPRVEHAT